MRRLIPIPTMYFYKGASCTNIFLEEDVAFGVIKVINDYNEVMMRVACGSELAQFIIDLQKGEWA